jgi:hypothetical protein
MLRTQPTAGTTSSLRIFGHNPANGFAYGNPDIGGGSVRLNEWSHIVFTRQSGVLSLWINGSRVLNNSNYTTVQLKQTGIAELRLGGGWAGSNPFWNGYLSNMKFTTGAALYSGANISVPTAPVTADVSSGTLSLLVNFTNAAITDATAKNVLETVDGAQIKTTINNPFGAPSGSMYFDGSGDYLAFQNGPNLNFSFGTANFTIEGWIYLNTSTTQTLLDIYDANSSGRILLQINTSRQLQWLGQSGVTRTQTSSSIALSTWTHFSVCRASGSTRIFIGGTQGNTTYPDTNNYTCTTGKVLVGINAYDSAGSPLNGYISNLRITKGFARHTANFTPPTTPFALR